MHEVLDAPDAVFGGEVPWWELLAYGADVWPLAGSAELFGLLAGLLESSELRSADDAADDDEAVSVEGGE